MPYFNRFDIIEAHYVFYSDYHSGQWSDFYKRLSRITGYFKPRPNISYVTLSENSKDIYAALLERHNRI